MKLCTGVDTDVDKAGMGQAGKQHHPGAHCTRIIPYSVNPNPMYLKDLQI